MVCTKAVCRTQDTGHVVCIFPKSCVTFSFFFILHIEYHSEVKYVAPQYAYIVMTCRNSG